MVKRLANVIYWICILVGVGWTILVYNIADPQVWHTDPYAWLVMLGVIVACWSVGWVINYVLTGRTTLIPE